MRSRVCAVERFAGAGEVDTMEWAITGYMLGYSITMPLAGWLADSYGRKALGIWGMGMMLAPAFGPWISGILVDNLDNGLGCHRLRFRAAARGAFDGVSDADLRSVAARIGARVLVAAGMALAAYGTFLFSGIDTDWTSGRITLDNAIRTGALGLLFTPLTAAALTNINRTRAGAASALRTGLRRRHPHATRRRCAAAAKLQWGIATVRAYGDTFLLGAAIVALSLPLALLLNHKSAR